MSKIAKKITLRDLYRSAGKIARDLERGISFEVSVRGKRGFKIIPAKENTDNLKQKDEKSIHDLFSGFVFKSSDNKMSSDVDSIVYDKD